LTAYSTYSDSELVALLSQGNQQAFETLYSRHWEDLFKTAFFILRDHDSCKDIVQDIFVWIWERRNGLEIQSLKSYLKAAVKFKVANYIRSGNIRESFFDELSHADYSASQATSEEMAEVKELNSLIQQAISHLPDKCREVFRLSRNESLTNQQIAERLGISIKTVENQMTIAIRRIRSEIDPITISAIFILFTCFR